LPKYIKFSDFASYDRSNKVYVNTNYLYRADGVKMRKVHNYKDPCCPKHIIRILFKRIISINCR
ncbi:hypothetical protein, partial [Chryseobacterium gambrini]